MAEKKQSSEERRLNEERRKKSAARRAEREKEVRRQLFIIGGGAAAVLFIILLAVLLLRKPSNSSTETQDPVHTQTTVTTESAEEVQETTGTEEVQETTETEEVQETADSDSDAALNAVEPVIIDSETAPSVDAIPAEGNAESGGESAAETAGESGRPADLPDIDVTSWEFILANADHPIGDYTPEIVEVENDAYVDYRIYDAITSFIADCRDAGNSVYLSSAYRSYETQDYLFQRKVEQYGSEEEAARIVLPPGTSEHQTGLAADITEEYYEVKNRELENTAMYQWMAVHCHEYGFIVRYPDGKEDITDIIYEPWHFRYVGVEAATYIMEHGITLEEFLAYYE